jgi:hypothetical protein
MADDVHRIELRAQTVEELRSFINGTDLDLGCRPAVRQKSGELVVEAYVTMPQISKIQASRGASGVAVRVIENASEVGRSRQTEVGSGNRLAPPQPFSGLGIKE